MYLDLLSAKERFERKAWLYSFLASYLIKPLQALFSDIGTHLSWQNLILGCGLLVLGMALATGLYVSCAYSKPGTKLLGLSLAGTPLKLATDLYRELKAGSPLLTVSTAVECALGATLFYFSLKLYRINRKLQQAREAHYLSDLEGLDQAASSEQLEALYRKRIETWPQYSKRTTAKYNDLKQQLEAKPV